jgi:hypothetical protein
MQAEKRRFRACGDVLVPYRAPDGVLVRGRFIGRDAERKPLPPDANGDDREEIQLTPFNRHDVLRALARGELDDRPPAPKPAPEAPAEQPAPEAPSAPAGEVR